VWHLDVPPKLKNFVYSSRGVRSLSDHTWGITDLMQQGCKTTNL
jgi:hypothetical protein